MRKMFIAALFLCMALAPHAFAQSGGTFVPLTNIPGLTNIQPNTGGLASFFNNLYKYLIGLSAALAVIMIIWQGIRISMNPDNVGTATDAKKKIYNAIFGLVLVLSPVLVFSIINPSILNLSINFQSLDNTSTSPPGGTTPGGGNGPTFTSPQGCTVTGNAGSVFQYAVCPSQEAANTWGQSCGGTLSTATLYATGAGGTSSYIILCTTSTKYVFIETVGTLSLTNAINRLQPLAKTTTNPNNGSQVMEFANACSALGSDWATCISDLPNTSFATTCDPAPTTQIPASSGGSGKCYGETLSCRKSIPTAYCSRGPSWTPFQ